MTEQKIVQDEWHVIKASPEAEQHMRDLLRGERRPRDERFQHADDLRPLADVQIGEPRTGSSLPLADARLAVLFAAARSQPEPIRTWQKWDDPASAVAGRARKIRAGEDPL